MSTEEQSLQLIVERIVSAVHPETIILFGSRAHGKTGTDTDFDILVIGKKDFGNGHNRFSEICRIENSLGRLALPVDILLYSKNEAEMLKHSPNHVVGRAFSEGKVIYAAA